ncbi:MAG: carboxypeptidase-like regulatory domain-containing protein [Pirellulaceae bacterium]
MFVRCGFALTMLFVLHLVSVDAQEPDVANKTFDLTVTNVTGNPVAGADVRFSFNNSKEPLKTGADGKVAYQYPDEESGSLRVYIFADGYVPYGIMYDRFSRSQFPSEKSVQLQRGETIGGTVVDPDGKPVAGANVYMSKRIDETAKTNFHFNIMDIVTTDDGRWEFDGAPKSTKPLAVAISHPGFPDAHLNVQRTPNAKYVLHRGLSVTGTITDPDGNPVEDAVIHRGDTLWGVSYQIGRTDAQGKYTLKNMTRDQALLTVNARGFAPQIKPFKFAVGNKNTVVDFKLMPGKLITIQVVDDEDKPLKGVRVVADTWRDIRTIDWRGRTDENGKVAWNGAPEDAVEFDVLLRDYRAVRNVRLKAGDETHKVVLKRDTVRRGIVKDAKTGAMIPEFVVCFGNKEENGSFYWSEYNATQGREGKFVVVKDEPSPNAYLRVTADGYKTWMSKEIKLDVPYGILDVRMEPHSGTDIVVLGGDKNPAANAKVYISDSRQHPLRFENDYQAPDARMTFTTDQQGTFTLPALADPTAQGVAAVVHDYGYAEIPLKKLLDDASVQLEAWARLSVTVMRGDKPAAGTKVMFFPSDSSSGDRVSGFNIKKRTDDNGRATFNRIVPRTGRLYALVTESLQKVGKEYLGRDQTIEARPGGEYAITVGGTGRSITGRVALRPDPPSRHEWRLNAAGYLSSSGLSFGHPDRRSYRFFYADDGTFRIDDVAPGEYNLQIDLTGVEGADIGGGGQRIGSAYRKNIDHPTGDGVHDIGTIQTEWELDPEEEKRRKMIAIAAAYEKKSAALYGRVLDKEGKPVTDAIVSLTGNPQMDSTTDSHGRYAFLELKEPRKGELYVRSESCVGVIDKEKAETIAVDPSDPIERNFTLPRACQLKIVVVDADGRPPKSFAIVEYESLSQSSPKPQFTRQVLTDKQGVALIGGLPASNDKWLIGVNSFASLSAISHTIMQFNEPGKTYHQRFELKPGKTVTGTVVYSDGKPAAGCEITPLQTWHKFRHHAGGPTINADGSFELTRIGDDKYNVRVFVGEKRKVVTVLTDVVLSTMKQPIEIKLDIPSPTPSEKPGPKKTVRMKDGKIVMTLRGQLIASDNADRQALQDATVKAWVANETIVQPLEVSTSFNQFQVDVIDDMRDSAAAVHISATSKDGQLMATKSISACDFIGATIRPIKLTMQRVREIAVEVTDENGGPVLDANVKVNLVGHATTADFAAKTSGQGLCKLRLPKNAQLRSITAWSKNQNNERQIGGINFDQDRLSDPDADNQKISLTKCRSQRFRIVDKDGKPVAGTAFRVAMEIPAGKEIMRHGKEYFVSDQNGEAVDQWFPDLEKHQLSTFVHGNWRTTRVQPESTEGVLVARVLLFAEPERKVITGRLKLPEEVRGGLRVLLARQIELTGYFDQDSQFVRSDLDGNFSASVLPGEKYVVCVDDGHWASKPWHGVLVELETGKPNVPTLQVIPGQPLTFQATSGPNRTPLANAFVSLTNVLDSNPEHRYASRSWFVMTDEEGIAATRAMPGIIHSTVLSHNCRLSGLRPGFGTWTTDVVKVHREVHSKRTIHGRITTPKNSDADLSLANVRILGVDPYRRDVEVSPSENGRFATDIAAADVVVFASTSDQAAFGMLHYPSDTIELELLPTRYFKGKVLDTASQPLSGKLVVLTATAPGTQTELTVQEAFTNKDGEFVFANVPQLAVLTSQVFHARDDQAILATKDFGILEVGKKKVPATIRVPRKVE